MLKIKKICYTVLVFCCLVGTPFAWCAPSEDAALTVQIPFSMKGKTGLALPGSKINAYFMLESKSEQKLQTEIAVYLPKGFSPERVNEGWTEEKQAGQVCLQTKAELVTKLDNWFDLLTFTLDQGLSTGTYAIKVVTSINGKETTRNYPVQVRSAKEMGAMVELEKLILPVNELGEKDDRYRPDSLIVRESKSEFYRSVFRGTGAVDTLAAENHPLTYLGVVVKNKSDKPLTLLITTELLEKKTGQPVSEFHLPEVEGSKQPHGTIQMMSDIKGRERKIIPLPLYLSESKRLGGEYLMRTKIKLLGSDMVLAAEEKTVQLITHDPKPGLVTGLGFILCFFSLGVFAFYQKKLLRGFQTKELILIALFGTASFLSVNIPGTIFRDVAQVILGPFGFLLTGLFNGVILYLLLVSLLMLLPRPGVIFLINLVRFLLNGIALGHFTPLTLLFYLSGALFLEVFLYLGGVTRKTALQQTLLTGKSRFSGAILFLAVLCAVADVISAYINFQGIIFLYRLYYAQWYIFFYLLIGSFLYTIFGTFLGVFLGKKLQKISTD